MAAVLPQPSNPFKQTPLQPGQYPKQRKLLSEDDKKVGPTALDLADEEKAFHTNYEPDLAWWTENNASYEAPLDDPLPEGYPERVEMPSDWDGKVLIDEPEKWLYRFTPADLALIDKAHDHFTSLKLPNNDIGRETFPIPTDSDLYKALAETLEAITRGIGFNVLRGLPVDEWARAKQIIVFAGLAAYLGEGRIKQGKQNIVHLRDITQVAEGERPTITVKGQTSGNQVFHNDGTVGIIGLITLGVAETGGLSQLSSVAHSYNKFASRRRDLLREMAQDDWKSGTFPDGRRLIFATGDKTVASSYSRRPFFGFYEADPDVPALSDARRLVLDGIHFTAEEASLDLELQKGDLEFFNNLTVFHARNESTDSAENTRHLLRIHLQLQEQPLPADVRKAFNEVNAGEAHFWPLEATDSVPVETLVEDLKL